MKVNHEQTVDKFLMYPPENKNATNARLVRFYKEIEKSD